MRDRGFAVESVCAVLREQGCRIAARTYRAWRAGRPSAARTHSDAVVIDALRATLPAWEVQDYGTRPAWVKED
jgi:putative transposase